HGPIQLIIGPVGDRFGKYRTVTMMCALASILVALCGTVHSLSALAVARFASGAAAGWIIPLSMAYVGDVTPYERRQPVLARYLSGQIFGQLFGQAAGGGLGDLFGWRDVFFVLAALFALATPGLRVPLLPHPPTPPARAPARAGSRAEPRAVSSPTMSPCSPTHGRASSFSPCSSRRASDGVPSPMSAPICICASGSPSARSGSSSERSGSGACFMPPRF